MTNANTAAGISSVRCAACSAEHDVDARPSRLTATEICDVYGLACTGAAYVCPCGQEMDIDDIANAIDAAMAADEPCEGVQYADGSIG